MLGGIFGVGQAMVAAQQQQQQQPQQQMKLKSQAVFNQHFFENMDMEVPVMVNPTDPGVASQKTEFDRQFKNKWKLAQDHVKNIVNRALLQEELNNANNAEPTMFECVYCCGLAYEPQVCLHCQSNLYCLDCTKKYKQCGFCGKNKFVPNNRLVQSQLEQKMVVCMMPNCSLNKQPITYEQLIKHAPNCGTQGHECPFCKKLLYSESQAKEHYEQECPSIMVQCECGEVLKRSDAKKHRCIIMLRRHLMSQKKKLQVAKMQQKMQQQKNDAFKAEYQIMCDKNKSLKSELAALKQTQQYVQGEIARKNHDFKICNDPNEFSRMKMTEKIEWLLNHEPFFFDHTLSHVPVNLWKIQPFGQITLDVIMEKNPDYIEYVTSETTFDFFKDPVVQKNRYKIMYKYYGQLSKENKKPCGIGRAIMEDNTIHEGLFYDGHLNGFGRSFYPDGSYYIGIYRNGKKEGEGKINAFSVIQENVLYHQGSKKNENWTKHQKQNNGMSYLHKKWQAEADAQEAAHKNKHQWNHDGDYY